MQLSLLFSKVHMKFALITHSSFLNGGLCFVECIVHISVPFLNLLFEQIANSNEYLLAKISVDTAENEPLEVWGKIFNIIHWCP